MNINKLLGLSLTILIPFFSSCSNEVIKNELSNETVNTFSAKKVSTFYPLKKGNSWTYELKQTQDNNPNTKFKEMTMFVDKTENNTAVLRRTYPDSTIKPTPSLAKIFDNYIELSRYQEQEVFQEFCNKNRGLNCANLEKTRGEKSIIIMQLPFETNHSWEGRIFQGGKEEISILGFEEVVVPAGKFNALKVQHHLTYNNGKDDTLVYWYAENVGNVKLHEEVTIQLGEQWMKLKADGVLKSFSVSQK